MHLPDSSIGTVKEAILESALRTENSLKIIHKVSQFSVFLSNLFTMTEQIISGQKWQISIWPLLQFQLKNLAEVKIDLILFR